MINNVTIGTDAEVFLKYEDTVISCIDLIGGSKEKPLSINNGCFVQEDNILAEFNIPPVTKKEEFLKYINYCKDWLEIKFPELNLHFSSSELVENHILYDRKAKEFGCKPDCIVNLFKDRDYYTEDEFEEINIRRSQKNLRTSGFHIHFGYDNPNIQTSRELVKMFEKYVTLPMFESDIDLHNRRSMYGQIGNYRIKPYGVECRSLGGSLLRNNDLINQIWDNIQNLIYNFNLGERVGFDEFENLKVIMNNQNINKIKKILN